MVADGHPKDDSDAEGSPPTATPPPAAATPPGADDWETRFKYLLADFDNFRRRTERDRAGVRTEAEALLLRRLIPLVEGFRQAEVAGRTLPTSDPLRRGLELLGHELETVLRSVGFAATAEVGEPFRAEEHEAVGEVAAPTGVSDGAVAEIVQQGYRFQGGLLRPAKVLVARAAVKDGTTEPATAEGGPRPASSPESEEGSS